MDFQQFNQILIVFDHMYQNGLQSGVLVHASAYRNAVPSLSWTKTNATIRWPCWLLFASRFFQFSKDHSWAFPGWNPIISTWFPPISKWIWKLITVVVRYEPVGSTSSNTDNKWRRIVYGVDNKDRLGTLFHLDRAPNQYDHCFWLKAMFQSWFGLNYWSLFPDRVRSWGGTTIVGIVFPQWTCIFTFPLEHLTQKLRGAMNGCRGYRVDSFRLAYLKQSSFLVNRISSWLIPVLDSSYHRLCYTLIFLPFSTREYSLWAVKATK